MVKRIRSEINKENGTDLYLRPLSKFVQYLIQLKIYLRYYAFPDVVNLLLEPIHVFRVFVNETLPF